MNQNPVRTRSGRAVRRPKVHFESAVQFAPPFPRTAPSKPNPATAAPTAAEMNGIATPVHSEKRNEENASDTAPPLPAAASSSPPLPAVAAVPVSVDRDGVGQGEGESLESDPTVVVLPVPPARVVAGKDAADDCPCQNGERSMQRMLLLLRQDLEQVQKERQLLLEERRAFALEQKQAKEEYRRFQDERRLLQDERQRVQDERQRFQDDRQRFQDYRNSQQEELVRLRADLKRIHESIDQSRGDRLSSENKTGKIASRHTAKRPRSA